MRIAVLTHTFPPSGRANAKRPGYVTNALLAEGYEVEVFTNILGCDHTEDEAKHDRLTVHNLSDPITKLAVYLDRRTRFRRLFLTLIGGLCWPDVLVLWSRKVSRILAKRNDFDLVLAFIFPSSLYICGSFNKLVDTRWCFDLQESVTPQFTRYPKKSFIHRALLPKLESLERRAMSRAGAVIFTADTNRKTYIDMSLVDKAKTYHLPYFYERELFDSISFQAPEYFEIRYFGTFDWSGSRSPEVFLKALKRFLESNPDAWNITKFSFYGSWLDEHRTPVQEMGLDKVVEINKAVDYEDYVKLVASASALLLVVAQAHNFFMPSKIVDYFGAQRPILAFVPRASEMRAVLDLAGMTEFTCEETDVEAGAIALEKLWQRHLNKRATFEGNTRFWSSDVQIPKYMEILEKLRMES